MACSPSTSTFQDSIGLRAICNNSIHNIQVCFDISPTLLPETKGMSQTSVKNASPLVRLDRLVGQEKTRHGILVVHEHEQLTTSHRYATSLA